MTVSHSVYRVDIKNAFFFLVHKLFYHSKGYLSPTLSTNKEYLQITELSMQMTGWWPEIARSCKITQAQEVRVVDYKPCGLMNEPGEGSCTKSSCKFSRSKLRMLGSTLGTTRKGRDTHGCVPHLFTFVTIRAPVEWAVHADCIIYFCPCAK